jgi:ATP synthase protein I
MSATPQRTTRDPFAAMLRGAFLPTLLVGPVAVVVAAFVGGGKAVVGALLGFAVAIAFFALGLYVMRKLDSGADPFRFLASALAVFFGQMIFLLLVILWLQGAEWLDGTAFGLSALAVALVWQVFQVVAYVRTRRLVFDEPSETGQDGGPHE